VTGLYTAFASVYDRLMADVDYPAWAAYYRELLRRAGVESGAVCECACGTGSLTLPLSKTYEMTGVDSSGDMLAVATDKARRAGLNIPFVQMDMRDLTLHRPVDGVLCTCDGVNYLPNERETAAFFRAAHRALRPGGALVFDVSTPYKLGRLLGNGFLGEDAGDIAYLWQNRFHAKGCRLDMRLTIFKRAEDGAYARIVEEQTQYGHTKAALKNELLAAGFTQIEIYGDRTLSAPAATEKRWHIAAVKKER
jgi:ubiquinone/menaquinone biosynthesis C-methylase UbiE